jgi:pepF/M3 family oligoendopeptidase
MTDLQTTRWDLTNVYPALDSAEYQADFLKLEQLLDELQGFLTKQTTQTSADTDPAHLASAVSGVIDRMNVISTLMHTLGSYLHSFISTDSYNKAALKAQSILDQQDVRADKLIVQFKGWIGRLSPALPALLAQPTSAQAHAFFLEETVEQSKHLMSEAEEGLAAELNISGANAWEKLQGTVTSQLSVDFELDGKVQKMSMPALINLRYHPDESVRRRAYEAENQAWGSVEETLAACLNGIKGTVNTLNKRRSYADALEPALNQARIDRPTLEAMLGAMHDSFPVFERYFLAKARRLGKEKLAWWDLFAPLGGSTRSFTFPEAREFILGNFASFAPELEALAKRAFDQHWIDAEQRVGKRGGAFCMGVPAVKESRVLCNFDGSLDQVFTVAHELGHAFHNECMYAKGKTPLQRRTPMTLAETASIMCETIVTEAALKAARGTPEEVSILETSLVGASQVIVDIYSRFLFEKELFERRQVAELSPDEINEIMQRAQKATYGAGLDEQYLQKYMWTWKPHYYSAGLSFYNFPYSFGQLFATGLYAIYQQRGAAFVPDYINLLASTGEGKAAELAGRFGIDIRSKAFWAGSLKVIEQQIDRYAEL